MDDAQIGRRDIELLIGVLAAVDGLAMAGLLDDHQLRVLARPFLRMDGSDRSDVDLQQYVHERSDALNQRLRTFLDD